MTYPTHQTSFTTPFPLRPLLAFPVRAPKPQRQGLSRRELRDIVAEILG